MILWLQGSWWIFRVFCLVCYQRTKTSKMETSLSIPLAEGLTRLTGSLFVAISLLNYFRFDCSVLEITLVVGTAWARLWSGPGVLLALEAVIAFLSPGWNHKSWVHCSPASGAAPRCHFLFIISHQCAVMNCTLQVNCTLSKKSRNTLWSLAGRWVSIWASEHFPVQENAAYWFFFSNENSVITHSAGFTGLLIIPGHCWRGKV